MPEPPSKKQVSPKPPAPPAEPIQPPYEEGQFVIDRYGRRLLDPDGYHFVHSLTGDPCCECPVPPDCLACGDYDTPLAWYLAFSDINLCAECRLIGVDHYARIVGPSPITVACVVCAELDQYGQPVACMWERTTKSPLEMHHWYGEGCEGEPDHVGVLEYQFVIAVFAPLYTRLRIKEEGTYPYSTLAWTMPYHTDPCGPFEDPNLSQCGGTFWSSGGTISGQPLTSVRIAENGGATTNVTPGTAAPLSYPECDICPHGMRTAMGLRACKLLNNGCIRAYLEMIQGRRPKPDGCPLVEKEK